MRGQVVEIGPGTGASLPYLPTGVRWIGIEPNRHMHPRLREKASDDAKLQLRAEHVAAHEVGLAAEQSALEG